jgi:hypothetical protein
MTDREEFAAAADEIVNQLLASFALHVGTNNIPISLATYSAVMFAAEVAAKANLFISDDQATREREASMS